MSDTGYRKLFHFCFLFSVFCLLAIKPSQAAVVPSPIIEFSLPESVVATEKFDINFVARNIPIYDSNFLIKFVAYPENDSKDVYHGCTFNNNDVCLKYSGDAWNKFPEFSRTELGTVSGIIKASIKNAADTGNFKGFLRLVVAKSTSYREDSPAQNITVTALPPPPEPEKQPEPDTSSDTNVETHYNASLPGDSVEPSETSPQPTEEELTSQTRPTTLTNPTRLDIKLPATFSAQEVPRVAGASTAATQPTATPEAQATPSSRPTSKYVIILGSLGIIGVGLTSVVFFLKRRRLLK